MVLDRRHLCREGGRQEDEDQQHRQYHRQCGPERGLGDRSDLAIEVDGQAQVSMNLVDSEKTPVHRAFDMVKLEAEARGVSPTWSEIVGLVPELLIDVVFR